MKACRFCNVTKPLAEFPLSKRHAGGYRNECTDCRRALARIQQKKYYQQNREQILEKKKVYDQANAEKIRAYQADYRARKRAEKNSI